MPPPIGATAAQRRVHLAGLQQHGGRHGAARAHAQRGRIRRHAAPSNQALIRLDKRIEHRVIGIGIEDFEIAAVAHAQAHGGDRAVDLVARADQHGARNAFIHHTLHGAQHAFVAAFAIGDARFLLARRFEHWPHELTGAEHKFL